MFSIKTRSFELTYEFGGLYVRLGQRDWYAQLRGERMI